MEKECIVTIVVTIVSTLHERDDYELIKRRFQLNGKSGMQMAGLEEDCEFKCVI